MERGKVLNAIVTAWVSCRDKMANPGNYLVPSEFYCEAANAVMTLAGIEIESLRSQVEAKRTGEFSEQFVKDEIAHLRSQVESANRDADAINAKYVELQKQMESLNEYHKAGTVSLSAEAGAYRTAFHKCSSFMGTGRWQAFLQEAETARSTFKREFTPTWPLFKEAWNKKIQAGFQWSTDNIAKAQMGWEMAMEEMRIRSYPLIGGSETTHVICICPDCVKARETVPAESETAPEVASTEARWPHGARIRRGGITPPDTRAAFAPGMAAEALRETDSSKKIPGVNRTEIMQAVVRGWNRPINSAKKMDSDLAIAITNEVCKYLQSSGFRFRDKSETETVYHKGAEALREAASAEIPQPDSPSMVALVENFAHFALAVAQSTTGALLCDALGGESMDIIGPLSEKAIQFAEAADQNVSAMKNRAEKIRNMLDALNMYTSSLTGEREAKLLRSYVDKLRGLCL